MSPEFVALAALAKTVGLWSGAAALVWKTVSFLQAMTKTAKAIPAFMEATTLSLDGLKGHVEQAVGNHLTHIEKAVTESAASNEVFASNMQNLRTDFQSFMQHNIESQTKILERLPEL